MALSSQAFAAVGPSTTTTPYLTAVASGVDFTSILTTGDSVGGYLMGGIPDGMGAYDNNDGTFTLLMNHELGATVGTTRAHGAIGAYVSQWTVNKTTLAVTAGSDLMTTVKKADGSAYAGSLSFARFCSADLPGVSAFYNASTGLGTQNRLFMNGEESSAVLPANGSVGSRAVAHTATGANTSTSYVLDKFGAAGWENLAANTYQQDKTIVVGQSDGNANVNGTNVNGAVAVYVGNKQATGNDVEKAGLNNGTTYYVNVAGNPAEITNVATQGTNIANGTAFTLSTNSATAFARPEDGAWDTLSNNKYYFVTTDRIDTVTDGLLVADGSNPVGQIGRSRLWRMSFADITNPTLGGTIDMLLDGTEGQVMMDNITTNPDGTLTLQEDSGNSVHNGKMWKYDPLTDVLTMIAKSDVARFGDVNAGVITTGSLTKDEETSGVINVTGLLGRNDGKDYQLLVMQNHALATGANAATLVEGGQLMLMSTTTAPVPEADTSAMLVAGLGLMGAVARRRNNKK
jgi:hypothetical protein